MGIARKIKKGAAAVVFALAVTLLCSCMDMEVGMVFNDNGSARIYMDMVIEDETLDSMGMTSDEAVDSMMDQMNEDSDMDDWLTESITKTIDGDSYSGARYYMDVTAEELLSTNVLDQTGEDLTIKVEKSGSNTKVTIVMNADSESSAEEAEQMREMMNFRFRMSAPNCKIVSTNGTYDTDGSVYWDLMDVSVGAVDSIEMTFEYSTGGGLLSTILIIAVVVLVIAALVIVVVRNANKPKPVESFEQYELPNEVAAVPAETPATEAPAEETAAPVEKEETVKFCADCGTKAEADAEFCMNCGKKF